MAVLIVKDVCFLGHLQVPFLPHQAFESPHSQVLRTSRSSLQYLHNRLSIHLDPCPSRERYFAISLSLSSDKSALSCVPLPTRFRSLSCCDMSCCGARSLFRSRLSVGYAPCVSCARSGQESAELANVLTNATHNGCLVCPLH